jgi:hypothetical protein
MARISFCKKLMLLEERANEGRKISHTSYVQVVMISVVYHIGAGNKWAVRFSMTEELLWPEKQERPVFVLKIPDLP